MEVSMTRTQGVSDTTVMCHCGNVGASKVLSIHFFGIYDYWKGEQLCSESV